MSGTKFVEVLASIRLVKCRQDEPCAQFSSSHQASRRLTCRCFSRSCMENYVCRLSQLAFDLLETRKADVLMTGLRARTHHSDPEQIYSVRWGCRLLVCVIQALSVWACGICFPQICVGPLTTGGVPLGAPIGAGHLARRFHVFDLCIHANDCDL